MNADAQHRIIAEFSGWRDISDQKHMVMFWWAPGHGEERQANWQFQDKQQFALEPGQYTKDLNLMYEAESFIPDNQHYVFQNKLREVVGRKCPKNKVGNALVSDWYLTHSTAADRAEALIRMLGKWVDA
jgi:hypothetical protein